MYPFSDDSQQEDSFPNYVRRRTIFDTPTDTSNSVFSTPKIPNANPPDSSPLASNPSGASDFAAAYGSLMNQPEGAAQSQYRQFLSQQLPDKEKFKPSPISRIGAILSGLSTGITRGAGEGWQTAQGILDEPYKEALSKYQLQGGRLQQAAQIEHENMLDKVKLVRDML